MEDTLKDLNRELEREIKKYEEKLDWIKNEIMRIILYKWFSLN